MKKRQLPYIFYYSNIQANGLRKGDLTRIFKAAAGSFIEDEAG